MGYGSATQAALAALSGAGTHTKKDGENAYGTAIMEALDALLPPKQAATFHNPRVGASEAAAAPATENATTTRKTTKKTSTGAGYTAQMPSIAALSQADRGVAISPQMIMAEFDKRQQQAKISKAVADVQAKLEHPETDVDTIEHAKAVKAQRIQALEAQIDALRRNPLQLPTVEGAEQFSLPANGSGQTGAGTLQAPALRGSKIRALEQELEELRRTPVTEIQMQEVGAAKDQADSDRLRRELADGREHPAAYALSSFAGGLSDYAHGYTEAIDGALPGESLPFVERSRRAKERLEDTVSAYGETVSPATQKYVGTIARGLGYSTPGMVLSMLPGAQAANAGKGLKALLKNPSFWSSAIPMYGSSYAEAIREGATEEEAQGMAILNGFAGAVVEVADLGNLLGHGGIQHIPTTKPGIRTWVKGLIDEGKEEVLQGVIEELAKRITYKNEREWNDWSDNWIFSVDGDDSLISLSRGKEEFLGGALVGGILGGGQTLAGAVAQNAEYSAIGAEYTASPEKLQQAMEIGLTNAAGTDARAVAEKIAAGMKNGKQPSAAVIGRMMAESYSEKALRAREIEGDILTSARENGVNDKTAQAVAALMVRADRAARFVSPETLQTVGEGDEQYSIVTLDDGKTYVTADRSVMSGEDAKQWRKQVTQFFNDVLLKNGSLTVDTEQGYRLTITKNETLWKGTDRHAQIGGKKTYLADGQYYVKLQALSHIDELAETAQIPKDSNGHIQTHRDTKAHSFAKDGFVYPTAFFEDADGRYYRVTFSVGVNGDVATIYNIGRIKETDAPFREILSVRGSKALGASVSAKETPRNRNTADGDVAVRFGTSSAREITKGDYPSSEISEQVSQGDFSDTTIPQNGSGVNTQSMQNAEENTQLHQAYGRYTADGVVELASNITTDEAMDFVIKHELTHAVEGSAAYEKLQRLVQQQMGAAEYAAAVEREQQSRRAKGDTQGAADAEAEVVADWIAQNLYRDGFARMIRNMDGGAAVKFQAILDGFRRTLGLTGNQRQAAAIRWAERAFAEVLDSDYSSASKNTAAETGDGGKLSYMNDRSFKENIDAISQMTDEEALRRKAEGQYITVLEHTPSVILDNVENAVDRKIIIRFDAAYLAARHDGALQGHYHNYGDGFAELLPNVLDNPDAILRMDNGRLNLMAIIPMRKGNTTVVSVELDTVKDINSKYSPYNLVVTMTPAKDNYIRNNIRNHGAAVEYIKDDLPQVNPQLYEWLSIINGEPSSNTTIPQNGSGVNTQSMQNGENHSSDGQKSYLPAALQERENAAAAEKAENARRLAKEQTEKQQQRETQVRQESAENAGERVSQATDWESIVRDIGEAEAARRIYRMEHAVAELGDVDIDGERVSATAYIDRYGRTLPRDKQAVRRIIRRLETEQQTQIAQAWNDGGDIPGTLPIDLQLFAAREQLAMLEINEDGDKVRKFIETRLKGQDATNSPEYLEYLAGRQDTYDPIGNKETLKNAERLLRDPNYSKRLRKRILQFRPGDMFTQQDMAAAQVLIHDAIRDGDFETAVNLTVGVSRKATEAGRAVQILSMQARLTPEGTLRSAKRLVQQAADSATFSGMSEQLDGFAHKLARQMEKAAAGHGLTPAQVETILDGLLNSLGDNQQQLKTLLRKKLKNQPTGQTGTQTDTETAGQTERAGKATTPTKAGKQGTIADLLIDTVEQDGFSDAKIKQALEKQLGLPTLDGKDVETIVKLTQEIRKHGDFTIEQAEAIEKLYDYLGKKLPVTGMEKWQAWRKLAMLANPKTHIRNMVSNVCMSGVQKADTVIGTLLENIFVQDKSQRSALIGWSLTEHGRKIRPAIDKAAERAVMEMQGTGKYDLSTSALRRHRQYFKTKWLNWINETNSALLEKEDVLSFRPAFRDALGQLMTVRGTDTVTDELYQMAMQRALEATFRADNALHDTISSLKSTRFKAVNTAMDVVVPFSKTPANIMVETVMHSPIGLVKATTDLILRTQGKSGKTVANICNEYAKALTGSVLMAIGLLLGHAGLFVTKYAGTEKERAYYELEGLQENSLRIGRVSVSLDWLQPTCAPLILGASLGSSLAKGGLKLSQVFGGVMDATDSLFELTMLQSLYDVAGGYNKGVTGSIASVFENLVSQSVPTLVGQTARLIDPVQRKGNKTSALTSVMGDNIFTTAIQQVMLRIPGLTYLMEPEMDIWGETVYRTGKESTGSAIWNGFQQILSPANVKIARTDDALNQAVASLYAKGGTGHTKALPSTLSHDKARELGIDYTAGYRAMGSAQREAARQLISNRTRQEVTVQQVGANGQTVRRKTQKYWDDMTEEERLNALARIYRDVQTQLEDIVTGEISKSDYDQITQAVLLAQKKK